MPPGGGAHVGAAARGDVSPHTICSYLRWENRVGEGGCAFRFVRESSRTTVRFLSRRRLVGRGHVATRDWGRGGVRVAFPGCVGFNSRLVVGKGAATDRVTVAAAGELGGTNGGVHGCMESG
ncbi:hypothetical protein NL676_014486 [Syzygium grande]|nr:hypothetical protein NL676_014486 [Syzygium grande]